MSTSPLELAHPAALPDGTRLLLRPIEPEDEPLLADIVQHMRPEDVRRRFFTPLRALSHDLGERLSHVDYAHDMALMALTADGRTALAGARFVAEPGAQRAEFALGVRSDWQRRGLGRLLIGQLVDIARERGIGELYGDVLHENEPMLRLCRDLGFALELHPEDATLVRVRKPLAGT